MLNITILIVTHLIFDFYLQSDWMAKNKSSSINALMLHGAVYTLGLAVASCIIFQGVEPAVIFFALNGLLHVATDAVTSRISSYFYRKGRNHEFFSTIGTDQAIHLLTLIWTLHFLS